MPECKIFRNKPRQSVVTRGLEHCLDNTSARYVVDLEVMGCLEFLKRKFVCTPVGDLPNRPKVIEELKAVKWRIW